MVSSGESCCDVSGCYCPELLFPAPPFAGCICPKAKQAERKTYACLSCFLSLHLWDQNNIGNSFLNIQTQASGEYPVHPSCMVPPRFSLADSFCVICTHNLTPELHCNSWVKYKRIENKVLCCILQCISSPYSTHIYRLLAPTSCGVCVCVFA